MSEPNGALPGGSPDEVPGLSYEQARAALDEVVRRLESSTVDLEQSVALWERGNALADVCQAHLDGARERIEAARPGLTGRATATPPGDDETPF
ncbi:MAG: exodeoxyribonuclease VII small subunit [Candidatus Nanopelagicales bacterium]|jgi:exodeoxyribonuclease VII small subunit|nr:exodeoxyribonuclease VII small subunit [Candidatus Nanopelagicales bacterium]